MLACCASTVRAADTDFFDRNELYLDGRVIDILIGDADGDALLDLFVFQQLPAQQEEQVGVSFFRHDNRDHFPNTLKQTWPLPEDGGFFDLADVTGDQRRELVGISSDNVFYYQLQSSRYDQVLELLLPLDSPPWIPPRTVRAWDFCWPLIRESHEVIALPRNDLLELWLPDGELVYSVVESLSCSALTTPQARQPHLSGSISGEIAGLNFCLPTPALPLDIATAEVYLRSPSGVQGYRRDALSGLAFQHTARFSHGPREAPFFSQGPFGNTVLVEDLNSDGALDLVSCENTGGITDARARVAVYYGPLSSSTMTAPHQQFEVENVTTYPQLADLDGDGLTDIILCAVEMGTITSAKMIVVKSTNLFLLGFRQRPDNSFESDPDDRLKVSIRLDTERPDLLGRIPVRYVGDLNHDRLSDFIVCPGEDKLDVYLGQEGRLFPDRPDMSIDCDAPSVIYPVDLNNDRVTDLVVRHHTKPSHVHKLTVFLRR